MLATVIAWTALAQATDYRKDLDELLDSFAAYGAYVREDGVDIEALRKAYTPRFAAVADRPALLRLVESVVGELRDHHASLGTNDDHSPRLVPSGADIIGHWEGERAVVDEVWTASVAAKAGVEAGDEIISIGGKPVRTACQEWLGVRLPDARGWDWALNSALAGTWDKKRTIMVSRKGDARLFELATPESRKSKTVLTVHDGPGGTLYLRPENSLGDNDLVKAFDEAVPRMRTSKGVVIDLRNTPSGGNSNVARGIMGIFIDKSMPFQRHRVEERDTGTVRDWVEYATPRLTEPVKQKVVVLVNHWTSSMGEGIAIGFDAMHRATVVGSPMAGLRGAVDRVELPVSKIPVYFPTEQVFHINGTPRHLWKPPVLVRQQKGIDNWMAKAKEILGVR